MKKTSILSILLLVVFCTVFLWCQTKILKNRSGIRLEEKILMLTDRPEVTRMAAMGFDAAVADVFWLRSIQYFGGNFSSLDKPEKRQGLINLLNNMVGLDPHFVAAYKFGGFVINEAMKDPAEAINFLLRGSDDNPEEWRLTFDAGFIAFYNLEDYPLAKQLFIQSAYGENIAYDFTPTIHAQAVDGDTGNMFDMDPLSDVNFNPENAEVIFEIDEPTKIGRIGIEHNSGSRQGVTVSYAKPDAPEDFVVIDSLKSSISSFATLHDPVLASKIKFAEFTTEAPDGRASIAEVEIYGASNPETPDYVIRMANDMDSKGGRFLAGWEQSVRYWMEAVDQGNDIGASVAAQKLASIYTEKNNEILKEAVNLYQEQFGKLPSHTMAELLETQVLQDVIKDKMLTDPNFANQIVPVLMPKGDFREMLTNWNNSQPYLLMTFSDDSGKEDWYIISREKLLNEQAAVIKTIQEYVDTYKKQKGKLPEKLEDMVNESWFAIPPDTLFKDPLEGEFFINPETGKVESRNMKY